MCAKKTGHCRCYVYLCKSFYLHINKCEKSVWGKVLFLPVTSCLDVFASCRNQSFQAAKRKRKGDQSAVTKSIVSLRGPGLLAEDCCSSTWQRTKKKHPKRGVKQQQAHIIEFTIHTRTPWNHTDTYLEQLYWNIEQISPIMSAVCSPHTHIQHWYMLGLTLSWMWMRFCYKWLRWLNNYHCVWDKRVYGANQLSPR